MGVWSGLQTERCLWEPYRYLFGTSDFYNKIQGGQILPVVCVYMDLWAENDFYIIKALKKKQRKRKCQRLYVSPKNLKRVISSPLQKNSAKPWTRGSFSQNDGALGTPPPRASPNPLVSSFCFVELSLPLQLCFSSVVISSDSLCFQLQFHVSTTARTEARILCSTWVDFRLEIICITRRPGGFGPTRSIAPEHWVLC